MLNEWKIDEKKVEEIGGNHQFVFQEVIFNKWIKNLTMKGISVTEILTKIMIIFII